MPFTAERIRQLIESQLPQAKATVSSDDNVHFQAEVVSPAFAGKSRVQQQQMVMSLLQPYILSGEIHALALKTRVRS